MSILKIKGVVQNYAWGGTEFISLLLGKSISKERNAEYWMGAHDKAPSIVIETGEQLGELIDQDPVKFLGDKVAGQFGRLPFLFKVLDVHDMLSIQVHPTKLEAEKGFERENDLGISISAPNRNYKDDNHKPEIMVALGEFWLLHGFRPARDLTTVLTETPELSHLIEVFGSGGYKGLYQHVMNESVERTNQVLRPLIERIAPLYEKGQLEKSDPNYWAAKAFLTFCPGGDLDKGIYSIYFFNIVKLSAGEAVYQDAGVPHAYMEGQNIELMANSDNVLRGGLTPKHVDVAELLKHVAFEETVPNILKGDLQQDGFETVYISPAPDFELTNIELNDGLIYSSQAKSFEIMIVIEGDLQVDDNSNVVQLKKGEVIALTAGTHYQLSADNATIYKARIPVQ